jgi:hypothetical protein
MDKYNQKLNALANVRTYLMMFISNLTITTVDSIKLQASALTQLTEATNQLTRTVSVNAIAFFSINTMFNKNRYSPR